MKLVALLAVCTTTRSALADEPQTTPLIEAQATPAPRDAILAPAAEPQARRYAGALVTFEQPRVWSDSLTETWRLVDRDGRTICELPCSSPVPPASGYVLEGVGAFAADVPSGDLTGTPATRIGKPLRLPLPDRIAVGSATFARLRNEVAPGNPIWARIHPAKGSPKGALALGIVSSVVLVFGATVLGVALLTQCTGDGCAGKEFFLIPGLGLTASASSADRALLPGARPAPGRESISAPIGLPHRLREARRRSA
jgi:hypothetical protein